MKRGETMVKRRQSIAAVASSKVNARNHPKTMQCLQARLESVVKDGIALPPNKTQHLGGGKPSQPSLNVSPSEASAGFHPNLTTRSQGRAETPPVGAGGRSQSPVRPLSPAAIKYAEERHERMHISKLSQKLFAAIQGPRAHGPNLHLSGDFSQSTIGGAAGLDEYGALMANDANKKMTAIGMTEYWAVRALFTEIDDDGGGWLSIAELLKYQTQHPKRVKKEIFQNLILDPDGRVFFDEFLSIHFPKLAESAIEQMIEQYEPKSQNVEILSEESTRALEALFLSIKAEHSCVPPSPDPDVMADSLLERSVKQQQHPNAMLSLHTGGLRSDDVGLHRSGGRGGDGGGMIDTQSIFSSDDRGGGSHSPQFGKGASDRAKRLLSSSRRMSLDRSSAGGTEVPLDATPHGSALPSDMGMTAKPTGGRSSSGGRHRGGSVVSHLERGGTSSPLFKKLKGRGVGGRQSAGAGAGAGTSSSYEFVDKSITLLQLFRTFQKPCTLNIEDLIELFKCRGIKELRSTIPPSFFHSELQRRERGQRAVGARGSTAITATATTQHQHLATTTANPFNSSYNLPPGVLLTIINTPKADGTVSPLTTPRTTSPQLAVTLRTPSILSAHTPPSIPTVSINNGEAVLGDSPSAFGASATAAVGVTPTNGAGGGGPQLDDNVSDLIVRLCPLIAGVPVSHEERGASAAARGTSSHHRRRSSANTPLGASSSLAVSGGFSEETERERAIAEVAQINEVWVTDPSCIYLLSSIYVSLPQFKVLLMEYYVMQQTKMPVELYNPRLSEIQAKLQWERLFPYTGAIKDYFKPLGASSS